MLADELVEVTQHDAIARKLGLDQALEGFRARHALQAADKVRQTQPISLSIGSMKGIVMNMGQHEV